MPAERDLLLLDARRRLSVLERRLIGLNSGILNATKQADRLSLAASVDSLRLDVDHILGLVENEIDQRRREG